MFCLKEKNAVVTGATGGIGESIVAKLVEAGAFVIASGTNEQKLADLQEKFGEKITTKKCNLAYAEQISELIKSTEKEYKKIDILVCNAGITKDNITMRMKDEEWDDVISINLKSNFLLIRNALRGMMKNKSGRIISIGSVVGSSGNPGQANYCASKAGIIGMTKSIATEVASRGITANVIAPGFIKTAMTDALTDEQKSAITANIPSGKMGTPEDIANTTLYLASDQSQYITGQTIHINGGLYMV